MTKAEQDIQRSICEEIRWKYPKTIFNSDLSGVNMSRAQAGLAKTMRYAKGFPDLAIYKPCISKERTWHGLFIEIKAPNASIISKTNRGKRQKGDWASDHLEQQSRMISELINSGYYASFGIGIDHCMQIIDNYIKSSPVKPVVNQQDVIDLLYPL